MKKLAIKENMHRIFDYDFALECFVKLQAYEQSGLSPDEVKQMKRSLNRTQYIIKNLNMNVFVKAGEKIER